MKGGVYRMLTFKQTIFFRQALTIVKVYMIFFTKKEK